MDPITEPHPSSSNSNSGYAFITHSQETLPLNLPPSIDNATLTRRRRRRTSAHDQAILEEEYRKCDRPDKPKRREITAKVQMGEKEVQIWFQNKRQSTRRKSKPLLPHEIIPHNNQSQNSTSSSQQSFSESSQPFSSSQLQESNSNNYSHNSQDSCGTIGGGGGGGAGRCSVSFSSSVAAAAQFPDTFSDDVLHSQGGGEYLGISDVDDNDEELVHQSHQSHQQSHQVAQSKASSTATGQTSGHKNNNLSLASVISSPSCPENSHSATTKHHHHLRQKASLAIDGEEGQDEGGDEHELFTQITMTTSAHNRLQRVLSSAPMPAHHHPPLGTSRRRAAPTTPKNPPRLLKRSSSIRLSTSLEGKASVVLEDEPASPPPPPPLLALQTPKIRPGSVSRSALKRRTIDSKVWEFCCDNQAVIRSPCQPHAEPSEATEALGLVRGRGNSSAHKPLLKDSSMGNSLGMTKPKKNLQKAIPSSPTKAKKSRKVISAKSARPKPALSNNTNANHPTKLATTTTGSSKKTRTSSLLPEPGQDSDKENRPPGAPVSPPPEPRKILGVPGKGDIISSAKKKRPAGKKTPRGRNNKSLPNKEKRPILEEARSEGMRIFYDAPPTSSQICETEYELPGAGSGGSQSFFDESSQESVANAGPGRVDEMECVENLLSLRGGVWG